MHCSHFTVLYPSKSLTMLSHSASSGVVRLDAAPRLPGSWPATELEADDSRHLFPHRESPSCDTPLSVGS